MQEGNQTIQKIGQAALLLRERKKEERKTESCGKNLTLFVPSVSQGELILKKKPNKTIDSINSKEHKDTMIRKSKTPMEFF